MLGIKSSGKTYSATWFAEQLLDNGVPFIAFDPIGVWRFLKVPGRGKGYKVVVAGGKEPDLPLTPQSAPHIVKAAMQANTPLVLDLYDMKLSKADWRRIVQESLSLLLHENQSLRHIFIEEASEFCPQRIGPESGRVYAEVEKMARMGGNASLGYTLINQRAEEVNKAVLELCDCLFLHRQKGRNSLTALGKWLDVVGVGTSKDIMGQIPLLGPGECFFWPAESASPVRVKMPAKNSFHPDRRNPSAPRGLAADVSGFVSQLRGSLEMVIAETKANDPAELKAEIVRLKAELKKRSCDQPLPGINEPLAGKLISWLEGAGRSIERLREDLGGVCNVIIEAQTEIRKARKTAAAHIAATAGRSKPLVRPPSLVISNGHNAESETVGGLSRSILIALAQNPDGLSAKQIGIRVGKSFKGGYFRNTLGALRTMRHAAGGNDRVTITEDGLQALGSFEPLPTGPELRQYWLRELGGLHAEILRVVSDNYPGSVSANDVGDVLGKEAGGGYFRNVLGRLRSLELITGKNDAIRASEDLFE